MAGARGVRPSLLLAIVAATAFADDALFCPRCQNPMRQATEKRCWICSLSFRVDAEPVSPIRLVFRQAAPAPQSFLLYQVGVAAAEAGKPAAAAADLHEGRRARRRVGPLLGWVARRPGPRSATARARSPTST